MRSLAFVVTSSLSYHEYEALHAEDDYPIVMALMSANQELQALAKLCQRRKSTGLIVWFLQPDFELAAAAVRNGCKGVLVWPKDEVQAGGIMQRVFAEVESERFQDDVVCMITHDLKIPLSSILGYSSLLLDASRPREPQEGLSFIRVIHSNGLKMLALIDNFLTTCKIEAGRLHLCIDDVDVPLFAEDLINTFKSELDRHDLKLETTIPPDLPTIEADETLLFRAIGNMLSNACKFSPEHCRLNLEIKIATPESSPIGREAIEFRVTNSGDGLQPEEAARIFEKFRRGSAHAAVDGMGIGSYVLKSIIEAHGGAVTVESVPKQLTSFSAWLPVNGPIS